ncbi:hypothetical protein A9C19_05255 [Bacillus weihaiensis]|uniref:Uncharacterized protein n=1 Tax=Bacillus weihaiensis TaxID=1547283 RepID=A0A1L3MPC0_9BACI|nr:hypothetical protein A9C19_05255 [Bacillus weihaiensis]
MNYVALEVGLKARCHDFSEIRRVNCIDILFKKPQKSDVSTKYKVFLFRTARVAFSLEWYLYFSFT